MTGVRRWALACCAAGAASVAAFGDLPLWPLPLAMLGVLLHAWTRARSAREAACMGFAFGAGQFLVGVSWVYVSLHDFGAMPAPVAALATLLFCLYLALFPALAGHLQARIKTSDTLRLALLAPACWTLTEWLRGWLLTGFPWLALGYAQTDGPLAGYAPLAGVYGVSLLSAIVTGCVLACIASYARRRSAGAGRATDAAGTGTTIAMITLIAPIILLGGGWLLRVVPWTTPTGAPLEVSLLQGDVPQELKFVPGRYEHTLATYERLARGAPAQLTVLPETAIPRFLDEVDPAYIARLRQLAVAQRGDMLIPVPIRDDGDHYYNAVMSVGSAPTQLYAKTHLVPFGEFVPPGFGWVVRLLHIPLSDFSSGGAHQRPMQVAGERVALNVCYEDAFGEEIIRQLPAATLLVNVSNVAWFGRSLAPAQHLRIARMRALETGRTMLRATNTGITAIIDHSGRVRARLPTFVEGTLRGTAQGRSGATPYAHWGNRPAVGLVFVLVAAFTLRARRRRA